MDKTVNRRNVRNRKTASKFWENRKIAQKIASNRKPENSDTHRKATLITFYLSSVFSGLMLRRFVTPLF